MINVLRTALVLSVFMFYGQTVFCAEEVPNEPEPTGTNTVTDVVEETTEGKFNDSDRLIQTLMGTLNADDSAPPEVPGVDDGHLTQQQAIDFVEKLSEEQVFALNSSLNNAVNSGLSIDYSKPENMKLLEKVVEDNYNSIQINALTQALEQEAKFQALAEKTGNEKFQEQAERQKEKFLSKIDKFQDPQETDDSLTEQQVGEAAKNISKEAAKATAKDAAKRAAKEASKEAAQEAVKEAANTAKKESVKERQAEKLAEREAAKAVRDEAKAEKKAERKAAKAARDEAKAEKKAARDEAKAEKKAERDAAKADKK